MAEEKEKSADEQYDDAWEEGTTDADAEAAPEEGGTEGEVTDEGEGETTTKEDQPAPAATTAPAKPAPLEGIEKALHDTKAYATRLAQENAKLREEMSKGSSQKEVAAAQESQKKAADDLKVALEQAYEDYPELKGAFDMITTELTTVRQELSARKTAEENEKKAADERRATREVFERDVKPEIVKVHADFDSIVTDPNGEFFKWAEKQSPAVQVAVYQSGDPRDMIWALGEFKKARGSGEAGQIKKDADQLKENNLNLARGLKGGKTPIPTAKASSDDYEAGWDAAGKILEKQGVK